MDMVGKLRVLVVAPAHSDLPNVAAEVAAVAGHHEAVVLPGVVRDRDIAAAIEAGPYDVVWFASHGSSQGILLSDGLLSIDGVGQYVRTAAAGLCVLNSCESEEVALAIMATTHADTICTIAEVQDRDASRLAILLARELARTPDYQEAYELVRPASGKYRYYRAGDGAYRSRDRDREREGEWQELLVSVYELRSDVRVMRTWLTVILFGLALVVAVEVALWVYTGSIARELASYANELERLAR
jgi:hypothetical protein